jgi:alanine dehydrogenase
MIVHKETQESGVEQQDGDEGELVPITTGDQPHVVIVGAGFGGINAAKKLGGTSAKVTIR